MKIHNIFLLFCLLAFSFASACGTFSLTTKKVSNTTFQSGEDITVKYPCVIDLEEDSSSEDFLYCPQLEGDFDRLYTIDAYIVNDLSNKSNDAITITPELDID